MWQEKPKLAPPEGARPAARFSRRRLLAAGGLAGLAALSQAWRPQPTLARPTGSAAAAAAGAPFAPIGATGADALVLPAGYSYQVLRAWGDPLRGAETFGGNSDFVAYFPLDALRGGASSSEGLLLVNHEYPLPVLQHNYTRDQWDTLKTAEMIERERQDVGATVMAVQRGARGWEFVANSPYNRRITARTPMDLTGSIAGAEGVGGVTRVEGTVGNCAGGVTPWQTALTCEENYPDYPLRPSASREGWAWEDAGERFPLEHFGYVVEIDPYDPAAVPQKRTALGRFRHEGAVPVVAPSGRVVVYMGDDKADECVYKFVSAGVYDPSDRRANLDLLATGVLYVADLQAGGWLPVDYDAQPLLRQRYPDQAAVLLNTDEAARAIGGTRLDRPEDIEVHPLEGSVYIALTNNPAHGNFWGQILRLVERDNDPEALAFTWDYFAVGGPAAGFASPDNLLFDSQGGLWMCADISSSRLGRGAYAAFPNNGMYYFPTSGPDAGTCYQFASGPAQSELTGPCFTPDEQTLFLAVQHPGEETRVQGDYTSHWPDGGDRMPRSAVVAVTGF